jgi:S-adenosylmethionine hydrolase
MADPIITLTTDFGEAAPFVAAMKGVILGINPAARVIDLSHQIPGQDLRFADFFLAHALPCFPPGVLHVVVVDPGVGTDRKLLYVEVDGHRLLVPDNGCWTEMARGALQPAVVRWLADPRYWRQPVSQTFHGRDILAPVAAHLSLGLNPELLGPLVSDWIRLDPLTPRIDPAARQVIGEVVFADSFGNLITNVPSQALEDIGGPPWDIRLEGQLIPRWVRTYGDAEPGAVVALVASSGTLEIAVVQGSAAAKLQAGVGAQVTIRAGG